MTSSPRYSETALRASVPGTEDRVPNTSKIEDRLRVMHVIGRMPRHGAQRQLVGLLRSAHGRYWDATLCVLRSGYSLTQEVADLGVPVIELDDTGPFDPKRVLRLRRLIRSGRFHVIHSSLWGCNAFTRLAATAPNRPAIVVSELSVENWRSRRRRALDRALRPLTDHYVGNSRDVGDFIQSAHGVHPHKVTIIHNGLDRDTFKPAPGHRDRSGPSLIGCMGRLIPDKGFQFVIQALPAILRHRAVTLEIAGEGDHRPVLESLATGLPVELRGLLATPREVADWLRQLDLFVMPSRYEGLPNAVLEAVGCGLPIVATEVPGMAEATGGRATLVPSDDPEALAAGILSALDRPVEPRPDWTLPSFDEVAFSHLHVFRAAHLQRAKSTLE